MLQDWRAHVCAATLDHNGDVVTPVSVRDAVSSNRLAGDLSYCSDSK